MDTQITIRLTKELKAKIQGHADADKRSLSDAARIELEWFHSKRGPKQAERSKR
jgi:hypothetical protein